MMCNYISVQYSEDFTELEPPLLAIVTCFPQHLAYKYSFIIVPFMVVLMNVLTRLLKSLANNLLLFEGFIVPVLGDIHERSNKPSDISVPRHDPLSYMKGLLNQLWWYSWVLLQALWHFYSQTLGQVSNPIWMFYCTCYGGFTSVVRSLISYLQSF